MTTSDQSELPAEYTLLWGLREPGRRGPRAGLSVEAIGAAAIAVADAEGLAAVSMARVAQELGAGTMSLYRYVSSKDELHLLMVELAVESPPDDLHTAGWRAGLARWATSIDRMLAGHRWYMQVPMTRPPLGPRNLAWLEAGMQCLRDTPLSHNDKVQAVMTLLLIVHGNARVLGDMFVDVDDVPQAEDSYWANLAPLLTADRFPALAEMIADEMEALQNDAAALSDTAGADAARSDAAGPELAGTDHGDSERGLTDSGSAAPATHPRAEFAFGVELALDGIAAMIDRAEAGTGQ